MKSLEQVREFEKFLAGNVQYGCLEIPPVKQTLGELIRRQQSGRPLEDAEPISIIERKQGHWPGKLIHRVHEMDVHFFTRIGLPLLDDQLNPRRTSSTITKKRSSAVSQRQKTSASIVTQKTTLPQIETIARRDKVYQVRIPPFLSLSVDFHQPILFFSSITKKSWLKHYPK